MNLTTFFVWPLGSSRCAETVAELSIIIIGKYSSINPYAQLPIVAELRPKQCSRRLRDDAASATAGTMCDYNLHRDEKLVMFSDSGCA